MEKIDLKTPKYNHTGIWKANFESIMNPKAKVTWPQLLAEYVIYWRSKIIKNYPQLTKGPGWSNLIQAQVRTLNQQMYHLVNFFPSPYEEPLVIFATKKYFRENRVMKVGALRKNRTKMSDAGNEVLNVSNDEKDVIQGIHYELSRAIEQRDIFAQTQLEQQKNKVEVASGIGYGQVKSVRGKKSLKDLAKIEKEQKNG